MLVLIFNTLAWLSCFHQPILSLLLSFDAFPVSGVSPRIPDFVGDSARASAVISPAAAAAEPASSSALFHARPHCWWDLEAPHSRPSRWGVNIPNVSEWIIREGMISPSSASLRFAHLRLGGAQFNPHSRIPRWGVNNTIRGVCRQNTNGTWMGSSDDLIGAIPQQFSKGWVTYMTPKDHIFESMNYLKM